MSIKAIDVKSNELYNNSYKEKNKRNLRLFLFFYI